MKKYIYFLKHPISNEIFYVGICKDIFNRLITHLEGAKKGTLPKDAIIRGLKEVGISPIIEVIEEIPVDGSDFYNSFALEREKYWIKLMDNKTILTNIINTKKISIGEQILMAKKANTFKELDANTKICAACKKSYVYFRETSLFCSDKCRVKYNRLKNKPIP